MRVLLKILQFSFLSVSVLCTQQIHLAWHVNIFAVVYLMSLNCLCLVCGIYSKCLLARVDFKSRIIEKIVMSCVFIYSLIVYNNISTSKS